MQANRFNGATRLHDWGVIHARGADARSFLHGQLTQDMLRLEPARAHLAGYCSAKGRLLASFVVWTEAPEDVFLACSADVLPATLKRLSMFVLRARCTLADASAERPLWGLAGAVVAQALPAAATLSPWGRAGVGPASVVRLPDAVVESAVVPRWIWVGAEPPALPALAPQAWCWLEVASGVARVVGATAEQFVPQMVNLELVGGVNFQKGCYPGQEVVARSQYRGTLKRRAFAVASEAALAPGQEIFHSADLGQPAGAVVLAASLDGGHSALVELKLSALQDGSLHAGAADGARLTLGHLPYPIPAEAA